MLKISEGEKMKTAELKIKRTLKANVSATMQKVKIKFPKQSLGVVAISFITPSGEVKQLKQFELWICEGGDSVKAVAI